MGILISSILGLVFGSFGNVCIYRVPKGLSVFKPRRSFCPSCRQEIRWFDNIPVASYILLKARCRNCGAKISIRYPAVELLSALVFALVYLKTGFNAYTDALMLGGWWLFMWSLIVGSAIDIELRIIPDIFTFGLCVIGIFFSPFNRMLGSTDFFVIKRIAASCAGATAGFILGLAVAWLGEKIFKKESFGGADIKLLAAFGAWMGATGAFWALFAASFVGSIVSVALILARRITARDYVPFGPYLSAGAIAVYLLNLKLSFFLF